MKKVFLLGDSIRLGYEKYVEEQLRGEAEVVSSPDNARFAKYSIWNVGSVTQESSWIYELGNPDIIHWNNGIWDAYLLMDGECFTPIEEYVRDMLRLYKRLAATGAKIIFATTTAVRDDCEVVRNADIDRYNDAILEALKDKDVVINDLNSLVKTDKNYFVCEADRLHMNDCGYARLGAAVAAEVKLLL